LENGLEKSSEQALYQSHVTFARVKINQLQCYQWYQYLGNGTSGNGTGNGTAGNGTTPILPFLSRNNYTLP